MCSQCVCACACACVCVCDFTFIMAFWAINSCFILAKCENRSASTLSAIKKFA